VCVVEPLARVQHTMPGMQQLSTPAVGNQQPLAFTCRTYALSCQSLQLRSPYQQQRCLHIVIITTTQQNNAALHKALQPLECECAAVKHVRRHRCTLGSPFTLSHILPFSRHWLVLDLPVSLLGVSVGAKRHCSAVRSSGGCCKAGSSMLSTRA
jgi:hypothetical protein